MAEVTKATRVAQNNNCYAVWRLNHPPPDLQALVERHGGYWQIPNAAWGRYQDEMRRWQQERRDRWLR
jgi:hypothetical protein